MWPGLVWTVWNLRTKCGRGLGLIKKTKQTAGLGFFFPATSLELKTFCWWEGQHYPSITFNCCLFQSKKKKKKKISFELARHAVASCISSSPFISWAFKAASGSCFLVLRLWEGSRFVMEFSTIVRLIKKAFCWWLARWPSEISERIQLLCKVIWKPLIWNLQ